MGLYDIRTTAEQLRKAAAWVTPGEGMADVELLVDDRMLIVTQGDERMAFDTDGSPASEEYLSLAPLDRKPTLEEAVRVFATVEDRNEWIARHFPERTCMESPGHFRVPGGDLYVSHLKVAVVPREVRA